MRLVLRLLAVLSFATFVVAATLAFSVRAASPAPPDGGGDAGDPMSAIERQLRGNEPGSLAGSKAFGRLVTPPGFGGLGSGGTKELVRFAPRLVELNVAGPLSRDVVERTVRQALGIRFGHEPCVVGTGDVNVKLDVSRNGAVRSVRLDVLGDGGQALLGADCVAAELRDVTLPPMKQPSTITLTLHLERAQVQ